MHLLRYLWFFSAFYEIMIIASLLETEQHNSYVIIHMLPIIRHQLISRLGLCHQIVLTGPPQPSFDTSSALLI